MRQQSQGKKYRSYTAESLVKAYELVTLKGVSVKKACSIYGVPRMTLVDRLKGRVSLETVTSGPKPIIGNKNEKKMYGTLIYDMR